MQAALDLVDQDIAAPAVFHCLPRVPEPFASVLHGLDEPDAVSPRQSCNDLLHDCSVRGGLGEGPHIFQVPRREARHLRGVTSEVSRQPVNDAGTPPLCRLASEDVAADAPIQQDQLLVDSDGGAELGSLTQRYVKRHRICQNRNDIRLLDLS